MSDVNSMNDGLNTKPGTKTLAEKYKTRDVTGPLNIQSYVTGHMFDPQNDPHRDDNVNLVSY